MMQYPDNDFSFLADWSHPSFSFGPTSAATKKEIDDKLEYLVLLDISEATFFAKEIYVETRTIIDSNLLNLEPEKTGRLSKRHDIFVETLSS